jgi:N-methylhydantoinase A
MGYRLGVDVGGTFTDLLLFDTDSGAFWRHKTPSTPHDSSEGILNGVTAICAKAGLPPMRSIIPARHDRGDQRRAGRQGRARGPGHHRRLSRHHADRAQLCARGPGRLDHLAQAAAAGALEDTVTVKGMDAQGQEVRPLDEADVRAQLPC